MPSVSRLLALIAAAALVLSSQVLTTGSIAAASEGDDASTLKSVDVGPVSMATSMECNGDRSSVGNAWVTLNGDYVTVNDHCANGNSVMARVQMEVNGEVEYWFCYNHSGGGTTKVCDFDWPEGSRIKTLIFFAHPGIRDEYQMGTLRHWRDG